MQQNIYDSSRICYTFDCNYINGGYCAVLSDYNEGDYKRGDYKTGSSSWLLNEWSD